MKVVEYQKIITNIEMQKQKCEETLYEFNAHGKNISNMTVKSINDTITLCREIQSEMDKLVRDDIYHIVGMANLSASQMSQFIKTTKSLMDYRTYVKMFAIMDKIPIPKISKESYFVLSSGIKLVKENLN